MARGARSSAPYATAWLLAKSALEARLDATCPYSLAYTVAVAAVDTGDDDADDCCPSDACEATARSNRDGRKLRVCMVIYVSQVPDVEANPAGMVERSLGITLCFSSECSMASTSERRPSLAY